MKPGENEAATAEKELHHRKVAVFGTKYGTSVTHDEVRNPEFL